MGKYNIYIYINKTGRNVANLLDLLLPQKKTRPLLVMAALLLGPAWMENTPSLSRPGTRVGLHVMICSVEPMPSWPRSLLPHAYLVLVEYAAQRARQTAEQRCDYSVLPRPSSLSVSSAREWESPQAASRTQPERSTSTRMLQHNTQFVGGTG